MDKTIPGRNSRSTKTKDSELHKLKEQIRELKARDRQKTKQIQQLRRELQKATEMEVEIVEVETTSNSSSNRSGTNCSRCRSEDVELLRAGIFNIYVCQDCGNRRRVKCHTT